MTEMLRPSRPKRPGTLAVTIYILLVAVGAPMAMDVLASTQNYWLGVGGMAVLILAVSEIMVFRMDTFGIGLSHRDAWDKMTGSRTRSRPSRAEPT